MASRLQDVILRGTAASRPAATAVAPGTLYYSTDTSTTDRCADSGTTWETYADAGTTPGLVLREQHTASSSATLDFTTAITSAYDEYHFEFVNVLPATNGAGLYLRVSTNGGSSYDSGANYSYAQRYHGSTYSAISEQLTQTKLFLGGALVNTAATGGLTGHLRLFNPLSTTVTKWIQAETVFFASSDSHYYFVSIGGRWITSGTAANAIQFFMDSGNIASGTIRCYGLAK